MGRTIASALPTTTFAGCVGDPEQKKMAKVEFDIGIDSVRGILMGDDPYYIRRYPDKNGAVMHIVQARPNRSRHQPTAAEQQNRIDFAERYGAQRHAEFMQRKWKDQPEIPFEEKLSVES